MSGREVDHARLSRVRVDAIHFHNSYVVALKPDVLSSKGADVDHTEKVCLPRLY